MLRDKVPIYVGLRLRHASSTFMRTVLGKQYDPAGVWCWYVSVPGFRDRPMADQLETYTTWVSNKQITEKEESCDKSVSF